MIPSLEKANLYAQKLNNSAAFCIEIGEFDRAISSLGKALQLSELHKDSEIEDTCRCRNVLFGQYPLLQAATKLTYTLPQGTKLAGTHTFSRGHTFLGKFEPPEAAGQRRRPETCQKRNHFRGSHISSKF